MMRVKAGSATGEPFDAAIIAAASACAAGPSEGAAGGASSVWRVDMMMLAASSDLQSPSFSSHGWSSIDLMRPRGLLLPEGLAGGALMNPPG